MPLLYGQNDENLDLIEKLFQIRISARGRKMELRGESGRVDQARKALEELNRSLSNGTVRAEDMGFAIRALADHGGVVLAELLSGGIRVPSRKKVILPKTPAQSKYIEAIRHHDVVLGIGPAGTGKTYLAMAMAVAAFSNQEVGRIILTRPAVEAGEHLGFLPGDLYQKIHPYLRPLYDALYDMIEPDRANRLIERGTIEIAPLAYMRGRTLNDSFIILDEGQNTTREQMKMFLTRLGFNSRVVLTGDITQIDLPKEKHSGLIHAKEILKGVPGIRISLFSNKDVIRHKLVQDIIRAYEKYEKNRETK
ncbi:MAG: PhoH family protein [Deltaproteobacteria bacterium]|nr:PhoH family protein [Deltaproteobacteria bacterium]